MGYLLVLLLVLFEGAVVGSVVVERWWDVAPIGWLHVCGCRGECSRQESQVQKFRMHFECVVRQGNVVWSVERSGRRECLEDLSANVEFAADDVALACQFSGILVPSLFTCNHDVHQVATPKGVIFDLEFSEFVE